MVYRITYNPPSPQILLDNDVTAVVITLTWDVGDIPPTSDDTFIFDLAMPQPIPTGAIDSGNSDGGFPYSALLAAPVNLDLRRAIFQAPFFGRSFGKVGLTGTLASQPAVTQPYEFTVTTNNFTLSSTGFNQIAIPIAESDSLDTTAPDELKSTLVVTAMTADPTPLPLPGATVVFTVANVASSPLMQPGNFFDMSSGTAVPINFMRQTSGRTATFTLTTNESGVATLVVVSNTKSGFFHSQITGGINTVPRARLYMYSQPTGRSKYLGPDVLLPFGKNTDFDTSRYSRTTFPIVINADVVQTEFCVAILNNKYQEDQPTSAFNSGSLMVDGKTEDLNVSRSGEDNSIFYAVSDGGALINSQIFKFTTINSKVGPIQGVQFGPFDVPGSSHLSFRDVARTLQTIIPLAADQAKLAAANMPALIAPNSYVVHAIVTGWDQDNLYTERTGTYPQSIADYSAQTDQKNLNVFSVFGNLGRSPDGLTQATWELWYTYHTDALGTGTQIGESIHTTGTMMTRPF